MVLVRWAKIREVWALPRAGHINPKACAKSEVHHLRAIARRVCHGDKTADPDEGQGVERTAFTGFYEPR